MPKASIRRIQWRRDHLPYGEWTCRDMTQILFNRGYQPIWQRDARGVVSPIDRHASVPYVHTTHFYNDSCRENERLAAAFAVLASWGISLEVLPKLEKRANAAV